MSRSAEGGRGRLAAVAALIGVIAGALWLGSRADRRAAGSAGSSGASGSGQESGPRTGKDGEPGRGKTRARPGSGAGDSGDGGDDGPRASGSGHGADWDPRDRAKTRRLSMIADAMEQNRFPPDSRPLTSEMQDVIRPYQRHESPHPIRLKRGKGEAVDPDKVPWYLLTASRYLLVRDARIEPRLEVYRSRPQGGEGQERVPVEIVAAKLMRFAQPDMVDVGRFPINDEGRDGDEKGGDGVYSASVDLGAYPALATHNGQIKLVVDFTMPGVDYPIRAAIDFQMSAAEPARFTGLVTEKLTPAGLDFAVQLEVKRAGNYYVQGLLFDANNKPIGFAIARPTLATGRRDVVLSFFGLLFHEAKAQSPYQLKTLTGSRLADDGEPFNTELAPWPGPYRSKAYKLTDFSDHEHESPEKDKLLDTLRDLAEKNPDKTEGKQENAPAGSGTPAASGAAPASSGKGK